MQVLKVNPSSNKGANFHTSTNFSQFIYLIKNVLCFFTFLFTALIQVFNCETSLLLNLLVKHFCLLE